MKEAIIKLNSDHIKVKGGEYVQDLVRCGECKHYDKFPTWSACTYWSADPYEQANVNADDYCSYGEVRDE